MIGDKTMTFSTWSMKIEVLVSRAIQFNTFSPNTHMDTPTAHTNEHTPLLAKDNQC